MNLSAIAKATATERTEFELPAPGVYKDTSRVQRLR